LLYGRTALSRAYRWQKLLDDGVYGSIVEMADKERINRSYVSRTIRLSLTAFGVRAKTPCALTHLEIAKVPPYSGMNP
jgi:hypothetical protein